MLVVQEMKIYNQLDIFKSDCSSIPLRITFSEVDDKEVVFLPHDFLSLADMNVRPKSIYQKFI